MGGKGFNVLVSQLVGFRVWLLEGTKVATVLTLFIKNLDTEN